MSQPDIDVKMTLPIARLRRLLQPKSGRSFVVALDHGFFAVPGDLGAIEDLAAVLDAVTAVGPDGVLMSAGQAHLLAEVATAGGRPAPALTVRGDVTNLYLSPDHAESDLVDEAGVRAVRLDAVALLVNLLDADDDPAVRQACLRNVFAAKAQCEHLGLALMVEPIPFERRDSGLGGAQGARQYHDVADEERLVPLVRQAVEAGADIVKAGILPDEAAMRRAIRVCGGVPYLARGGSKGDDREVLGLTRHLLDCGAAGVVFGRNIFQHERPVAMAAALKALIHDDASVDTAVAALS
jgi:class I fructose-bisphosphate aldolase